MKSRPCFLPALLVVLPASLLVACGGGAPTGDLGPAADLAKVRDVPPAADLADEAAAQDVRTGTDEEASAEPSRTDPEESDVEEAVEAAGDEASAADVPVGPGVPCQKPDDCPSGLCLDTGAGSVCTRLCVENCPSDWVCRGTPLSGQDPMWVCVPMYWAICRTCASDADCKTDLGSCVDLGLDGLRCVVPCGLGQDCPDGFRCDGSGADAHCLPSSGSCSCQAADVGRKMACRVENALGSCPGERLCGGASGWGECVGQVPKDETCNGLDDDCDGDIDEGLGSTTCGLGICRHVQPNCVLGTPRDCDPLAGKQDEVCNGLDDDCDGVTDEDLGSTACGQGLCLHEEANCRNGLPQTCNPLVGQQPEQCNGVDDDCNGLVDDGLGTTWCGLGACYHGQSNCVDGAPASCDPLQGRADETCNGVDDDCDGQTDEGFPDTDLDGLKDCVDCDADGDGVPNANPGCPACGGAGEPACDVCPLVQDPQQKDSDGDGIGDACDCDRDGDGVPNDAPGCPPALPADDCPLTPNADQADTDADGIGDACACDLDGDGRPNASLVAPLDPAAACPVPPVPDNCPFVSNPGQEDGDLDGIGDACDCDIDNDGVANDNPGCPSPVAPDNCPTVWNLDQADADGDGIGDACDCDIDGDGVPNNNPGCPVVVLPDDCPFVANPGQKDTDGDGVGDACDCDIDNDGVANDNPGCPPCAGAVRGCDNCTFVANSDQANCDGDALGNACDPDDDNDGAVDLVDCAPCDPSVYPGAVEACNGADDNCNGVTDEGTAALCSPYACGGKAGCLSRCDATLPCAPGWFCDANDIDGDGRTDDCVPLLPGGSPCRGALECADGTCNNGYCCGAPGSLCCAGDGDCASLDTASQCDAPGSCRGHRNVGACNGSHVCVSNAVNDPSGCQGAQCFVGNYCAGNTVRQDRFCDAGGGCNADGNLLQDCQGANTCCDYGCAGGACGSAFRSGDIGCVLACYYQPVVCFCW